MERDIRTRILPSEDKEGLLYADALLLADMQVPRSDRIWFTAVPKDMRAHDFVFYLGCHVLKTTHLIETTVKILERMGIDFIAIGGPQNCCGIGDYGRGDRSQTDRTMDRLSTLVREKVLMWCPSCNFHIGRAMGDHKAARYDIEHATQFISDHIEKIQCKREVIARVALHSHTGSKQQDQDAEYAEKILRAIPGVQTVGVKALSELGRHCSNNTIEKLTEEKFLELIRDMLDEARQKKVDILATIYHGCQREICGEESRFPIKVENYVTLLARAMGIEVEDKFKKWKLIRDPEKIIEDAKDCISANNLSLDKVRATLSRNF